MNDNFSAATDSAYISALYATAIRIVEIIPTKTPKNAESKVRPNICKSIS